MVNKASASLGRPAQVRSERVRRRAAARAADAAAVERRAVLVFSVSVAVVAVPAGALRQLDFQQSVDDFDRVQNAGIVGGAQSEAHQGQRIRADDAKGALHALAGRTVLDGNETLRG